MSPDLVADLALCACILAGGTLALKWARLVYRSGQADQLRAELCREDHAKSCYYCGKKLYGTIGTIGTCVLGAFKQVHIECHRRRQKLREANSELWAQWRQVAQRSYDPITPRHAIRNLPPVWRREVADRMVSFLSNRLKGVQ